MAENKTNALAVRLQQAQDIKQAVACFIPENEEEQNVFSKNCLFYLVKNKAQINGDTIQIGSVNVDLFEYLQKMYQASKAGLSLIEGEFSFITYDGGEVVVVPDFRAEKRIAESKGLTIAFVHGKEGDRAFEDGYLKYTFDIKKGKEVHFMQIQKKTATSRTGKSYAVNEVENDIIFYGAVAKVNATGETFAYVESTENILLRANPKTLKFYKDPNAKDTMFEKFVLRQLIKRLPSNLRGIDFDKWEGKFENVEDAQIIEEPTPTPTAPKPTKEEKPKLPLVKDSDTWSKMIKAIEAGKVKDIASIEKKYQIDESDRPEILEMFMAKEEQTETAEGETTPSPMDLFK